MAAARPPAAAPPAPTAAVSGLAAAAQARQPAAAGSGGAPAVVATCLLEIVLVASAVYPAARRQRGAPAARGAVGEDERRRALRDEAYWRQVKAMYLLNAAPYWLNCGGLGPTTLATLEVGAPSPALRCSAPRRARVHTRVLLDRGEHAADAGGRGRHGPRPLRRVPPDGRGLLLGAARAVLLHAQCDGGDVHRGRRSGFNWAPDAEVIFESHAHPGGSFPWLNLQNRGHCVVRIFEPSADSVEDNLARIRSLITPRTKLIQARAVRARGTAWRGAAGHSRRGAHGPQVSHVTCTTGLCFPWRPLRPCARRRASGSTSTARRHGARGVRRAPTTRCMSYALAQSAGMFPVDLLARLRQLCDVVPQVDGRGEWDGLLWLRDVHALDACWPTGARPSFGHAAGFPRTDARRCRDWRVLRQRLRAAQLSRLQPNGNPLRVWDAVCRKRAGARATVALACLPAALTCTPPGAQSIASACTFLSTIGMENVGQRGAFLAQYVQGDLAMRMHDMRPRRLLTRAPWLRSGHCGHSRRDHSHAGPQVGPAGDQHHDIQGGRLDCCGPVFLPADQLPGRPARRAWVARPQIFANAPPPPQCRCRVVTEQGPMPCASRRTSSTSTTATCSSPACEPRRPRGPRARANCAAPFPRAINFDCLLGLFLAFARRLAGGHPIWREWPGNARDDAA